MTTDEQGRLTPPPNGNEAEILQGFLDFHRATFEWKCSSLDADGLRTALAPSTLTLGGLLKHLTYVESVWFSYRVAGEPPAAPWADAPWDDDEDWEFTSAAADEPDELFAQWRATVAGSRRIVADALADGPEGLARPTARPLRDGSTPSLRWVLTHLVEEYCRHNGHADLIREAIDGSVGE